VEGGPCLTEDLVLALATGGATELERATIELHLDSCDACQMLVAAAARDFDSELAPALTASATLLPGTLISGRYRVCPSRLPSRPRPPNTRKGMRVQLWFRSATSAMYGTSRLSSTVPQAQKAQTSL
jgi:hypothetical protein